MNSQLSLEAAPSKGELSAKRIIKVSASTLAQVMVGETSCIWSPWVQTHYSGTKDDTSGGGLLTWKLEHTYHLHQLESKYVSRGIAVHLEDQNSFEWELDNGIILTGRPDAVAFPQDRPRLISDIKTGQRKDSHKVQVMLYMLALPLARDDYKGTTTLGHVVYPGRSIDRIEPSEITKDFRAKVGYWAQRLGGADEPLRRPGKSECRFCSVSKRVCPDRFESPPSS